MFMRSDLAALRVRKDVNELSKAKFTCSHARTRVDFPDGADNMLKLIFFISIADNAGPYANGDFRFFVEIPKTYPFQPPTVTCLTRTWHPNIDVESGRVMMAILGKDWRPVLSINTVLLGLQLIFLEPGFDYVLNPTAAEELQRDTLAFRLQVQQILLGGRHYGYDFPEHPRQAERRRQDTRMRLKRAREESTCYDDVTQFVPTAFPGVPGVIDKDEGMASALEPSHSLDVCPLEHAHAALLWKRMRLN